MIVEYLKPRAGHSHILAVQELHFISYEYNFY